MIQGIKINTDSLCLYDFKGCEDKLIGKRLDEQTVWECIEQYIEAKDG